MLGRRKTMKAVRPVIAALLLSAGACTTTTGADSDASAAASAAIRDASGRVVAQASLREGDGSIRVHVEAAGLAPGTYGTHVHTTGLCELPAFASAGAHWNPTGKQHGTENPQGSHFGDLPNLVVDASGRGSIDYTISGGSISGAANPLLDTDGAAIVVHAQGDDYRTDPSGNSGARIACGVIARG
jgi:Cu-Zn family superoxide dismutase